MAYATNKILAESVRVTEGENGIGVKQTYRVDGISTDADFLTLRGIDPNLNQLVFARNLPNLFGRTSMPRRGDQVTFAIGFVVSGSSSTIQTIPVFCTNLEAHHPPGQPVGTSNALVEATFAEIGKPVDSTGVLNGTNSTFLWINGLHINGSATNVMSNFGWGTNTDSTFTYGKTFQVYYRPSNDPNGVLDPNAYVGAYANLAEAVRKGEVRAQYARIPALESLFSLQVNGRQIPNNGHSNTELRTILGIKKWFNGSTNSASIWGFDAYQLRLRVTVGALDLNRSLPIANSTFGIGARTALWDISYLFEYRQRGWKEVALFRDPRTGFAPPDAEVPSTEIKAGRSIGNGWTQMQPLIPRAFVDLGFPDLRTLGV